MPSKANNEEKAAYKSQNNGNIYFGSAIIENYLGPSKTFLNLALVVMVIAN